MSEIGTQGLEILVENPDEIESKGTSPQGDRLVSWVLARVGPWRDYRNRTYNKRWAEYWRLWRGIWSEADKNRDSERSRLIAPALAQAIEMSVAEVEEALLSREVWFDISDDIQDEEKVDALLMRDLLREDLEMVGVKSVISESVLVAAIFGTGIVKVNVSVAPNGKIERDPENGALVSREEDRVIVDFEALRPDQCIPDPAGNNIEEMLGFAVDYRDRPVHGVLEKIRQGTYLESALPFLSGAASLGDSDAADYEDMVTVNQTDTDKVDIVEYHGKVPLFLLEDAQEAPQSLVDQLLEEDFASKGDDGPLVEAIVTIANEGILLRAIVNPFVAVDRSIIAFPWETVPGRFWGRGVSEKGYHPQKALDAEMRARSDALGFVSAPMLGMDSGRIPRGFKPEVKPGKVWLTQGNPDEVLRPVQIGNLDPNTFNQTGELMQMVQMGTGAFDTASALGGTTSSGGNAANSGSMLLGAFVKRSKRAIQNVDRRLVSPLIRKAALRYMQFSQSRYPFKDTKFIVRASLGIVAREIEQVNLTQLIAMLPEEAQQSKLAAAKGFIEMSSAINKADILKALEADQQAAAQAQEQQAQLQQQAAQLDAQIKQLEQEAITLENQLTIAKIRQTLAQAEVGERKADQADVQVQLDAERVNISRQELEAFERQNEISLKRLDLQEKALQLRAQQQAKQRGTT